MTGFLGSSVSFILISAIISVCIGGVLLAFTSWKEGRKFWLPSLGFVPIASILYGIWIVVTFELPQDYMDAIPDPGPANFAEFITFAMLVPVYYLVGAVPALALLKMWHGRK
ncbi:MAG: hypothetical protein GW859_06110 [Sphingomonadales bacterium]|nr:hypothetical protein [Sphingomonadales bacterium]